ncbi:MAG: hypothetical protein ABI700_21955 [Chloroflexota bacterium]
MRAAIVFFLALMTCPLLLLFAPTPTPTPTPVIVTITPATDVTEAHVAISADQTTVRVGDTVTISAVPVMIGLSIFTMTLSSGGSAHVRYDNQEQTISGNDAQFEIVSMSAEMYHATFTLHALAAGSVDVTVTASGEVEISGPGFSGAYSWSARTSPPLTITVNP